MENDPKAEYIEKDLFNELRWLLCAATEWVACKMLAENKVREPCFHLQVYTMDSALLHARSLYEFFTATKIRQTRVTWRDYSCRAQQESEKYKEFIKPLHGRVMHINKDRAGYEQVKNEVVNFASDILALWNSFSRVPDLKPYAPLLEEFRDRAIGEAASVAEQYKDCGIRALWQTDAPH